MTDRHRIAKLRRAALAFVFLDPPQAPPVDPDSEDPDDGAPFGTHLRRAVRSPATLVAAVVVAAAAVHTARAALDEAVRKVHPIGVDGRGVNSLHDGNDAIRETFSIWAEGYARLRPFMSRPPTSYATAQTWLELVLVVLTSTLLCVARRALARRKADDRGRLLLRIVALGTATYLVLGLYNQIVELVVLARHAPVGFASSLLGASGAFRFGVFVLTLAGLAVTAIHVTGARRAAVGVVLRSYRVMLLVVVAHAALLLFSIPAEQSEDALRLWTQSAQLLVLGVGATMLLGVTLGFFAIQLGKHGHPNSTTFGFGASVRAIVGGAVIGLIGWALGGGHPLGPGLMAVGAITVVVFALSIPVLRTRSSMRPSPVASPGGQAKALVPAVVAAAPMLVLMVTLLRAAVPLLVERGRGSSLIWTSVVAGALAVAMFVVALAAARSVLSAERSRARASYGIGAAAVLVVVAVSGVVAADVTDRAPELGVIAIMSMFLTVVAGVFGLVANATESRPLPAALDYVGFRRLPVATALVVLGLVSHQFADGDYHAVTTRGALPPEPQLTVDRAFAAWLARDQSQPVEAGAAPTVRPARPLVFIAAAGGGIKAAAFTASVIDCVFAPTASPSRSGGAPTDGCAAANTWDDVFVASGASGGSVGIAAAIARADTSAPGTPGAPTVPDEPAMPDYGPTPEVAPAAPSWVVESLGGDLLSAPLAWQLLIETPNAVLSFNPGADRAEVLEDVWRGRLGGAATEPFYVDQADPPGWQGPYAFFSGTNLDDGCRVNVSRVRAAVVDPTAGETTIGPAGVTREGDCTARRRPLGDTGTVVIDQGDTRDAVDYLCGGENIDLATAAFLSARFPYVSPTGVIRCHDDDTDPADQPAVSVGDGGYRDNSGASSVVDVMAVLEPLIDDYNATHADCVVPVLLEIESGYAGLDGPDRVQTGAQFLAPPLGALNVFGDLSYGQIEQAVAMFTRELDPTTTVRIGGDDAPVARHVRVSLVDHPGVTAPLGWSLSEGAISDFRRQLTVPENAAALEQFRSLVGGDLVCAAAP